MYERIGMNTDENNISFTKNNKFFFVLHFISLLLLVMGISTGSQILNIIAFVCCCLFCLITPFNYSVLIIFSLSIFEGGFTINGDCGWFFLAVIIIVKWIVTNGKKVHEMGFFLPFCIILILEACIDWINHGFNGGYLTVVVLIVFMYIIFSKSDDFEINPINAYNYFATSYLLMTYYLINEYGGLSTFISIFMSRTGVERFGGAYNVVLSGAMGIPIYSLLIIAISIPVLFYLSLRLTQKLFIYVVDAIAILIGLLTVSRSFLLGSAVIVLCLVFFKTKGSGNSRNRKILFIFLIAIGAFIAAKEFSDVFQNIINSFTYRIESDSTGGTGSRFDIASECFRYLGNHILPLMFGNGAYGYLDVAQAGGYLISMGCHNYYLDILMSFGIVGTIATISFVTYFIKRNQIIDRIKAQPFSAVPLLVLMSFCLTALRTNSIKPVIYFFMCFMIIKCMNRYSEVRQ